jgi:hypothetical protein
LCPRRRSEHGADARRPEALVHGRAGFGETAGISQVPARGAQTGAPAPPLAGTCEVAAGGVRGPGAAGFCGRRTCRVRGRARCTQGTSSARDTLDLSARAIPRLGPARWPGRFIQFPSIYASGSLTFGVHRSQRECTGVHLGFGDAPIVNGRRAYSQRISTKALGCSGLHAHNGAPRGSRVHARMDEIHHAHVLTCGSRSWRYRQKLQKEEAAG